MSSELTVVIKGPSANDDNDITLRVKHLIYDTYTIHETDETILRCVNDTVRQFAGTPEHITVNIKLEIS